MIEQYGFESIKLKAGVFTPDEEADAIKALKQAFPNHQLRIDPNGNWSIPTSIRIAKRLANDLEYFEDPTPGLEGMSEVFKATGLPQATNMVVTSWDHLKRPKLWRVPAKRLAWVCQCIQIRIWVSA